MEIGKRYRILSRDCYGGKVAQLVATEQDGMARLRFKNGNEVYCRFDELELVAEVNHRRRYINVNGRLIRQK